jgi:uncharacterized OB-fold protein
MLDHVEPVVLSSKLEIPYNYYAGPIAERFYNEIAENRRIMGIRCPKCDRVLMPPRGTCGRCFSDLSEWVEVGPLGTLINYTIVHYREPIQPMEPPFAYGLVRLDGTKEALLHLLGGVDPSEIKLGMRVQPVFREDPVGNILDIKYFSPVSGG